MKTIAAPRAIGASQSYPHGQQVLRALGMLLVATRARVQTPDELVRTTSQEVLTLIKQSNDAEELLRLTKDRVVPHFDIQRMTQLTVGISWLQTTPEQRQRLADEFCEFLVRSCVTTLPAGTNATLHFLPFRCAADGSEVVVRTLLATRGSSIAIDYRMQKDAKEWKVHDVNVNNVSLLKSYRETFATMIVSSGIDGLIKMLADRNTGLRKWGCDETLRDAASRTSAPAAQEAPSSPAWGATYSGRRRDL